MLEIYDRVLPSHSVPTLVALIILATSLYAVLGILDLIRGRILVRVGASLDEAISDRVYDAMVCLPLKAGNRGDGLQSLRHLDNLRSFLSGMGPIALFDLPWIPLYLIICFAFHTLIGLTALFGAIILMRADDTDRGLHARLQQTSDRPRDVAQQPRRHKPAQCRGARRDGHDPAAWRSAGVRPTENTSPASSKPATSPVDLHRRRKCCA